MKRKVVILMRNLKMGGAEKVLISFLKNIDREMYDVRKI
ncbi:glycosyltransferase [Weissella confusa]|nr:glycosyltransferase [Weissella confusa]